MQIKRIGKVKVEKIDDANVKIEAKISKDEIQKRVDKLARKSAKEIHLDGFRKGKVPPSIVKKLYGKKLEDDAKSELILELLDKAKKELKISDEAIIGDPYFEKYEDKEDGIELEIILSLKPEINIDGYKELVPEFEVPKVTEEEVENRLKELAKSQRTLEDVKEDRALEDKDIAVIDFEGFLDGEAFEGGSAKDYQLEIGSGSFVGDFEKQLIGMKKNETKEIDVKFPEDYHVEKLKGANTKFKVTLKGIKKSVDAPIDDELAKKILRKDNAKLEDLKEQVKKDILKEKLNKLYLDELKNKYLEAIVQKYNFSIPQNILEQEIDTLVNQKAQTLSEKELEELKGNKEKLEELRESVKEDAINSVKATFLVDAIAKAENIDASDDEVYQVIYYEALMSGQDPQSTIKYYEKNNLLPALKMAIIEDKLFNKLFKFDEILK